MMNHVQKAQEQIRAILCELEKNTGQLVESIEISTIDVTQMTDSRTVIIDMRPIPDHRWD
jgi:hypothetical protein